MYLDPADLRPRSLFDKTPLDPRLVGAGVGAVALVASTLVGSFLLWALITTVIEVLVPTATPPELAPIDNVVQARFVQLGEVLDPHELPNREVPILRTDTPDPQHAPSLEENPPPPAERPLEPRQHNSVDDALRRLSEDAQVFAEREEARVREGDPDGIEGGTERTGTEGDLYRGRLSLFFRNGWTVPTTIPEEVVRTLVATVIVDIADDTRITGFRLGRSSGNADFDQSVEAQLTRITQSAGNIPPPPEEVAAQFLGRPFTVNFLGRNARR